MSEERHHPMPIRLKAAAVVIAPRSGLWGYFHRRKRTEAKFLSVPSSPPSAPLFLLQCPDVGNDCRNLSIRELACVGRHFSFAILSYGNKICVRLFQKVPGS